MDNTKLLWIAAIGTAVASTWRYLKVAWDTAASSLVLQVEVSDYLAYEVLGYFWDTCRAMPLNPRRFSSWQMFVKSSRREELVAFEVIGRSGILFWKGWIPFWVTSAVEKDEKGGPGHEPDEKICVRYMRGTLRFDDLIVSLISHHNRTMGAFNESAQRSSRFQVLRRMGRRGSIKSDAPDAVLAEHGKPWADSVRANRRRKPLGQNWNNLGEAPDNSKLSPFDFLAYPDTVMETVRGIERWMETREWYIDRHIPWRRGFQLSGPPGSGKSSFIRAIGEHIGLPINVFDLASMTNEDFVRAWAESCRFAPCIIAIEDIDSVFHLRENVTSDSGKVMAVSFDCILNCISGVVRSDGILLFITTNLPQLVDAALTRIGRIDEHIMLDGIDEECRRRVANVVLDEFPDCLIDEIVIEGEGDQPAEFHERCARAAETARESIACYTDHG